MSYILNHYSLAKPGKKLYYTKQIMQKYHTSKYVHKISELCRCLFLGTVNIHVWNRQVTSRERFSAATRRFDTPYVRNHSTAGTAA